MSNLSGFVKRLRDIMRNDAGINGDAQRIEQIAWMLFLKVYDAKEQDWAFDDECYVSILPEVCRWANWAHDDKSGSAMTGDKLLGFVNNTLFPVLKGKDVKDASGKTIVEGIRVTAQTPIKKAIVQTVFADANQYMKDGVLLRQVINVIDELDLSDYEESHAFNEIYEGILKELQSAGSAGEFYTPRAVTDFMARMIQPRIGEQMADFACGTGGFITSWLGELQKQIKNTADAKKYGDSIYGIEKKQFPYMLCNTNLLLHGLDVPQVFHDNTLLHDVLVVLAVYSLLRISVGNTFIACMLTIIGYSVNDTIVIFDRIRENLGRTAAKQTPELLAEVANKSLTQTLSRSINTSLTTFIMVFMLFLLGVASIREFALPLMAGLLCGAYSSICIATELWYIMRLHLGKNRLIKK